MVCPVSDTVVIDVGNTAIKVARFDSHELISVERVDISQTDLPFFFARFLNSNDQFVIASSGTRIDVDNLLPQKDVFEINHATALPITVDYETPETVGIDRLANAVMSAVRFPNQAVLVVDLGSCITFDLTVGWVFRGGAISPGLTMRTRAMHAFTARLPQVTLPDSIPLIGKSTVGALQSGALNGWLSEIKGMSTAFATLNPDLQFVYTGGDLSYFEQGEKRLIFADPNWTLKGYYEIYRFNAH
jgi:type III pantothenate kinase